MKDNFGREITYMRMSITELCDLRCRYCMPENGVCRKPQESMLTLDEMTDAVKAAASLGIRKLRITGGEPLVNKDIVEICRRASAVEGIKEVCITTNGIMLPRYADDLKSAGVDRINMSLDTLSAEKYSYMTRRGTLQQAAEGLRAALAADFKKIKINTVLIGGFNDDEIEALAELTMRYPVDVRFIELMPMPGNRDFGPEAYIPNDTVLHKLPQAEPLVKDGSVARLYRLPGAMGNIGLISPVSAHFCAECNRIRLTADGKLKPCLHSIDEYPIKGMTQEEMREQMIKAIMGKPQWHGALDYNNRSHAGRNMNQIGG